MAVSKCAKSMFCLWLLLSICLLGCEDFIQTDAYLALQVQLGPSMTAGNHEEPEKIILSIGDNSRELPIIKGGYTEYVITLDSFGEIIVKVEVIGKNGEDPIWEAEKSVDIKESGITYVTFSFPYDHDQGSGE
jgi:hypothetical protein